MKRPDSVPDKSLPDKSLPDRSLDRTTPVPNALLDTFLPHLSDTELRVLLVVDRATLGWKEGTGRKKSDWLSHRQLQVRTGRAGASVSHAVERLVRRGLLIVEDGSGQTRDSTSSRRAARGRLYYRLSDALLGTAGGKSLIAMQAETQSLLTPEILRGEVEAHVETHTEQEGGFEQVNAAVAETTQEVISSSPLSPSTLRVQKLKTTKETGTKEKEDKMSSSKSEVNFLLNSSAGDGIGDGTQKVKAPQAEDNEPQEKISNRKSSAS